MKFNHWFLLFLSFVAIWLVSIRVKGIWLNLRAHDFVSKEIRAAEEAARLQYPNINNWETFYTKNIYAEDTDLLQKYDPLCIAVSFFYHRRYLARWLNYDAYLKVEEVWPEEPHRP